MQLPVQKGPDRGGVVIPRAKAAAAQNVSESEIQNPSRAWGLCNEIAWSSIARLSSMILPNTKRECAQILALCLPHFSDGAEHSEEYSR